MGSKCHTTASSTNEVDCSRFCGRQQIIKSDDEQMDLISEYESNAISSGPKLKRKGK